MNIDEALAAVATLLQSSTGTAVQVTRPAEAVTGLVVWPWRVVDVPGARNIAPTRGAAGLVTRPQAVVEVSFLLLASPAGSPGHAGQVLQAHRALLDNPVIGAGGGSFQVFAQPLSVEELAALFTAAQWKLSLCTNYVLRLAL